MSSRLMSGGAVSPVGTDVPQLVTVTEAAEMLHVKPAGIRKWLSQKRLTRVKIGHLTRVRTDEIADVIANGLRARGAAQRLDVLV